jgi:hypothetical protein
MMFFDGIVLRVFWVNLHNKIYNGPVKNHDFQEENAWHLNLHYKRHRKGHCHSWGDKSG